MKLGKATGPDGIPGEFFKNLDLETKKELLRLFNCILEKECIPEVWSNATTLILYKKGDPLQPINYRPISLLNSSMKIFMQIITCRLKKWASTYQILPEEQAGFRERRGCDEQIFNLTSAIQLGTRQKRKVYALFIDFKRAFPSVPHEKLWNKLYNLGISAKTIQIFQSLYEKCSTRIRLEDGLSETIRISEGLMQGCVSSPLLFTLYISDIIQLITNSGISG
jgi:hypothetical protein